MMRQPEIYTVNAEELTTFANLACASVEAREMKLREAVDAALWNIKCVTCDPDGGVAIDGTDEDHRVMQNALTLMEEALALPTSTEHLDAIVAERVKNVNPDIASWMERDFKHCCNIADLTAQLAAAESKLAEYKRDAEWISVEDKLPNPRQFVLISYATHYGKQRITMGWYAPAKTVEASDFSEEVDDEYDEETDTYYLKEGWVDESTESEWHYTISNVTHWMPLPTAPAIDAAIASDKEGRKG